MTMEPPKPDDELSLKQVIENFIQTERLTPKLEQIDKKIASAESKSDQKNIESLKADRQQLLEKFSTKRWLAKAVGRSSQIKLATHAPKYLHPDAKGSSIYLSTSEGDANSQWVRTAALGKTRTDDVVGNAAALDVYKLLKLRYRGKTVLELVEEHSDELAQAMSDNAEEAKDWMRSLESVTKDDGDVATHSLAKQVYFPIGDKEYHLLAPLFPTSLAHAVYEHLQKAQFSEGSMAARKARREHRPFDHGCQDYPDLAVQNFGGSKPQNISQLNSERRGEAWLLPSCPPSWDSSHPKPPIGVESIFNRILGSRPGIRLLTQDLATYLATTDYNNVNIRKGREDRVNHIIEELMQFIAELNDLESGWSKDSKLVESERLCLDQGRALLDEEFAAALHTEAWMDEFSGRFANWLNKELRWKSKKKKELHLGDAEFTEWQRSLKQELRALSEEFSHD